MSSSFKNSSVTSKHIHEAKPEFLKPHEVALRLGVSRSLIHRLLRDKTMPGFKVGRSWLVRSSELERFLAMKEAHSDATSELN